MWDGIERRKAHRNVHRLAQAFADLTSAEKEVSGYEDTERRFRTLCLIRDALNIIRNVVDNDIGKTLM